LDSFRAVSRKTDAFPSRQEQRRRNGSQADEESFSKWTSYRRNSQLIQILL